MNPNLIVFDMDGVLVDPTESFRRTVLEVVKHFCGRETTFERIVEIKNEGGYNDDADVALRIIRDFGADAERQAVADHGYKIFWGQNADGLIQQERWLPEEGLMERLAERARLAIFTGRGPRTANHSLSRFCPKIPFDPVVTSDLLENLKPAPDGLLRAVEAHPGSRPLYVGDNLDDARAARAAGAPFVGIAEAGLHQREELVALFEEQGAVAVIEHINQLESVL